MKNLITALVAIILTLSPIFAEAKVVTGVVNINTASQEQLVLVPGLGKTKAGAIMTYREAHPFKATEELTEVKGIGPALFKKVEQYLTIQGPTTIEVASSKSPRP